MPIVAQSQHARRYGEAGYTAHACHVQTCRKQSWEGMHAEDLSKVCDQGCLMTWTDLVNDRQLNGACMVTEVNISDFAGL